MFGTSVLDGSTRASTRDRSRARPSILQTGTSLSARTNANSQAAKHEMRAVVIAIQINIFIESIHDSVEETNIS